MAPLIGLAFKLLPLLSAIPEVVDALKSGNAEAAAGKVVETAKVVMGESDPELAVTKLLQNPEKQLDYQKALIAERVRYAELASQERMAQAEIVKLDAQSDDKFRTRWRPALGWMCVAVIGLTYIPKALVMTGMWCWQVYLTLTQPGVIIPPLPAFPDLGATDVIGILGTLLGTTALGYLRSKEKQNGLS